VKSLHIDEIKQAVFQLIHLKQARSNGVGSTFYQKYWDIMGSIVHDFFKKRKILEEVNHTL